MKFVSTPSKMANRTIAVILLCVVSFGCKQPAKNVPMYNIPVLPDAFSFAYFKLGTYWIYLDSATHRIDSQYVVSANDAPLVITGATAQYDGMGGSFGSFNCVYQSSYEGAQYTNEVAQNQYHPSSTTIYESRYRAGQSMAIGANIFQIPYSVNTPLAYDDTMIIVTDNTSFILSSATLTNVLEINHSRDQTCNNLKTRTFIKKGYGLLRKEVPDSNRVWNLIRCHIVQ